MFPGLLLYCCNVLQLKADPHRQITSSGTVFPMVVIRHNMQILALGTMHTLQACFLRDTALRFAHQDLELASLLGMGLRSPLALCCPRTVKKYVNLHVLQHKVSRGNTIFCVLWEVRLGLPCWAVCVPG